MAAKDIAKLDDEVDNVAFRIVQTEQAFEVASSGMEEIAPSLNGATRAWTKNFGSCHPLQRAFSLWIGS